MKAEAQNNTFSCIWIQNISKHCNLDTRDLTSLEGFRWLNVFMWKFLISLNWPWCMGILLVNIYKTKHEIVKINTVQSYWNAAIDILYTLDSASSYSAIQKLKRPWLQIQDIPMKWQGSYMFSIS
jgi:hypothetical protein